MSPQSRKGRRWILISLTLGAFLLLTATLFYLQIIRYDYYRGKSTQNQMRPETIQPFRGQIRDRRGRLIADNAASYSVWAVPAIARRDTNVIRQLSGLLERDLERLQRKFNQLPGYSWKSFRLLRNLDFAAYARLEEHLDYLPGITVRPDLRRNYLDTTLAHVVGYLGEVREQDLTDKPDLQLGDLVGVRGVEKVYDRQLRGEPGTRFVQVNALGRIVGAEPGYSEIPSRRGKDLFLGIDLELQHLAHELLGDRSGTVLLMDSRNGEMLVGVSRPDFNPNVFGSRLSQETWQSLNDEQRRPLFSRIQQAVHPPGSTYKMVIVATAMQAGISHYYRTECIGAYVLGDRVARCWLEEGHGWQNMRQSLAGSCDVYYYRLGLQLDVNSMAAGARSFHFGELTGVDLPGEQAGLVPDSGWYNECFGKRGWTRGVLLNLAIGQGEVLVTPIQLLQYIAILANGGWSVVPHFGVRLLDREQHLSQSLEFPRWETVLPPVILEVLQAGMEDVVATDGGTASWLRRSAYTVAGKTGTAENPQGEPHSWFVAYAPAQDPQVALTVLVEHGGHGSEVAAPIAFRLLDRYFELYAETGE
ncbi:penicillin-binding protein 2 [bacterium]|nr:penicillin-binding protein 2 [bacterium]